MAHLLNSLTSRSADSFRALEIAQRKKAEGDMVGALKFAKKSQSLFSSPQTKAFINTLSETPIQSGNAYASGTSATATPNGEGATSTKKQTEHRQGRQDTQYTEEQVAIVERVRKCKHHQYYEILELEMKATDSEIKKRYAVYKNRADVEVTDGWRYNCIPIRMERRVPTKLLKVSGKLECLLISSGITSISGPFRS